MTQNLKQLEQAFINFQQSRNRREQEQLFTFIVSQLHSSLSIKFKQMGVSASDIEDLIQELFIRTYLSLQTFDFTLNIPFEHYLNCMVRSLRNDFWRKRYAEANRNESLINEYVVRYKWNKSSNQTEAYCLTQAQSEQIRESLLYLSNLERSVAQLMLSDYSPTEIARKLNIKDKVVYNSIQRCKMKMRKYLNQHYC
ncbi:sigma-70 family RNA polymerase sigma factor [Staphylococcus petrasii]|uniref:sigma-70 family RNA polymerase sigma factor n=1 Tax=Staphylococcus petrasii TaxID=1276936 RepID=UPI001F5949E6|nr:sigma-70 family RNA polymerase sigma factor [Staphylococcus petrasii]MCI2775215.1 sigma-70 family RNA polymerase sigma factor [Staphylococcus petrasii]